jgi:hypothetical protein
MLLQKNIYKYISKRIFFTGENFIFYKNVLGTHYKILEKHQLGQTCILIKKG